MANSQSVNLDAECAESGRNIVVNSIPHGHMASDVENPIQKSLGVLQEDGIYAFTVYLDSKNGFHEGNVENEILKGSFALLEKHFDISIKEDDGKLKNSKEVYDELGDFLSENLDEIFLAKDLMEKSLTYARYHAKTLSGKDFNEEVDDE